MQIRAILSVLTLLAAPLGAQAFTGTLTVRMSVPGVGPMDVKAHLADGKQAMVMAGGPGVMANAEMRMVINPAERRITTFTSMPGAPGGGKFKQVQTFAPPTTASGDATVTVTKLGTSQTVAGLKCDDYELVSQGETTKMCATEALGRFNMSMEGANGRGATPAWARALRNRNFFPLKVWNAEGGVSLEVTAVDRTAPAAALFDEDTPGYATMPGGMPGMRRN